MSAQAGSIGSIVLGVVLIVATFWIPGVNIGTIMAGMALIAGGAVGLTFNAKVDSQASAQAHDLQIATAAEGHPIPVIFGEQKVTGNFMRFEKDDFTVRAIKSSAGGKGGSKGKQIMGYIYGLRWEYALCMGPVDEIGQVYSAPGEKPMRGSNPSWLTFSGDYTEVTLDDGENESGLIRIYKGSASQTRDGAGDPYTHYLSGGDTPYYRNICWVLFGVSNAFEMGRNPQPRTYQFLIRRLPKCVRDDGTTVTGIQTRGSATTSDPSYNQANPAAILYECLTNKLWGRGLSSDIINEASFVTASEWFRDNNIGMSFTLSGTDKLSDVLDGVRKHVRTLILFDGDKYKLKCLLDPTQTHANIQTLTKSEVNKLRVSRPDWFSTINEIRAEFMSRHRNYRPDTIGPIHDMANRRIVGRINPMRIQLTGFTDWNLARKMALRILHEHSRPLARAEFEINRYKSQLEVGDVFRLIWDEWGAQAVTAYFEVRTIGEGASDDDSIKITAVEDLSISPVEGEETTVTAPTEHPWQKLADMTYTDAALFQAPGTVNGEITPKLVYEYPAVLTRGQISTLVTGQRPSGSVIASQGYWSKDQVSYNLLGNQEEWAIAGTLTSELGQGNFIDRSSTGFTFTLANSADGSTILADVTLVDADSDDMETLLAAEEHYFIIGEEILQVGKIEFVSGSTYRARNLVRGMFGTPIEAHPNGRNCFYFKALPLGLSTATETWSFITSTVSGSWYKLTERLPEGETVYFRQWPVSTSGVTQVGTDATPYHRGSNDTKFLGLGSKPLAPEPYSIEESGGLLTVKVRPRLYDNGAEMQDTMTEMERLVSSIGSMTFEQLQYDAAGLIIGRYPTAVSHTFAAGSFDDTAGGLVTISGLSKASSSAKRLKIFAVVGNARSVEAAEFLIP